MGTRSWTWLVAGALATAGAALACNPSTESPQTPQSPPTVNLVAQENALPGDRGWELRQRAAPGQLEAYASATSVEHGEPIDVHVRADARHTLRWKLYRMGWYGGAEGRLVATGGPVDVGPQPTPAPDAATGRIECTWPVTFTVKTDPAWTSGVYLAALTRDDGPQSYVIFVLRADERKGVAVFQASFTTYEAYNRWGGKSLYDGGPAVEVSFDRPFEQGSGSGQYFLYEHEAVKWLEARGYDVVYVTNVDLDRDPSLLAGQRIFLSVGHDEYWSTPARDGLEAAIGSGVSAAFISANSIFWQIRLEPGRTSGVPRRTIVCYKKRSATYDPLRGTPLETTQWRNPPVSRPENALIGVMYTAWIKSSTAWIVHDPASWVYDGTGVREGDRIEGIVGYETDRTVDDPSRPTPPGTQTISRSPVVDVAGRADWQEGAVRDTPAGGVVFAAGTIQWAWGLAKAGYADARVQRVTENVLHRAGVDPGTAAAR